VIEDSPSLSMSGQLPDSSQVNVLALSRLFVDITNSYKYLFFLSLLDILRRNHFEIESVSFEELIVEMLANAWFPHTFFKLSFGSQDKISQKLDSLDLVIDEPIIRFRDTDKTLLRQAISSQNLKDVVTHLQKYVPYRLIIPFVENALDGVNRGRGDELERAMPAIADCCFESHKPLYKFDATQRKDCQAIIIHSDWANYLKQHYAIVRGWTAWEWLTYMQKRNPSTPAIANKLFMPSKRDSLSKQTDYWNIVMQSQELRCIFSDQVIDPQRFSLDHYLPWSFVAHDQLWNLVPILPEVNSAKSNRLPADEYFDKFVTVQHQGLVITHSQLSMGQWNKRVEPYLSDLGIADQSHLLDRQLLENAYASVVKPLITLAASQGFGIGWRFVT